MAKMIFKRTAWVPLCLILAGCAAPTGGIFKSKPTSEAEATAVVQTPTATDIRPKPRPPAPTGTAAKPLTVDTATNVTEAEIAAAAKPTQVSKDKGTTIASLGLLNQDGLWLSTPLVTSETSGRVVVEASGASLNVTLIPNGAASGSGSQISIAAMQALGVSITDLVELRVFTL